MKCRSTSIRRWSNPAGALGADLRSFHAIHELLYGAVPVPVELVAAASSPPARRCWSTSRRCCRGRRAARRCLLETRLAYFDRSWIDTPNFDRAKLAVGDGSKARRSILASTIRRPCCCPAYYEVDQFGNLQIWPSKKGN